MSSPALKSLVSSLVIAPIRRTVLVACVPSLVAALAGSCGGDKAVEPTTLIIEPLKLTMNVGDSACLIARRSPTTIRWDLKNPSDSTIVRVSRVSAGCVSAITVGTATITATAGTQQATAEVTVQGSLKLVSDTSITFSTELRGGPLPTEKTVRITSENGEAAIDLKVDTVGYVAGASGWLVPPTLSKASTPATLTLRPRVSDLETGTYSAFVRLSSSNAKNSPLSISVSYIIGPPPDPTLALDMQPIFEKSNCGICHAGPNGSAGVDLSTADKSYASLVNQPVSRRLAGPKLRVNPFDTTGSYLLKQLTGRADTSISNMPVGCVTRSGCLDSTVVKAISRWIAKGAKLR